MTDTLPEVRPISDIHQYSLDLFSCGEDTLDAYLQQYAKRNHKSGIGKTFVLMSHDEHVIGFYTISMASIEFTHVPEKIITGVPLYPVPTARIGRLAIDAQFQGKKYGGALLMDALKRIYNASQSVAAFAVIVDAKNDTAKSFYEHFEFIPYGNDPLAMFLPTKTLEKLFKKES